MPTISARLESTAINIDADTIAEKLGVFEVKGFVTICVWL
jgi:hypothetical protein